jgi:hypothetical protein
MFGTWETEIRSVAVKASLGRCLQDLILKITSGKCSSCSAPTLQMPMCSYTVLKVEQPNEKTSAM